MKAILHGAVERPAVAVVGVWDPFVASHRELMCALCDHARACQCAAVAVLIDPPPGTVSHVRFRYGTAGWPVYDSVMARVHRIRECGVDAVLRISFAPRDYTGSAARFLDLVGAQVSLAEIWLGALQHLGPGENGSGAAVARYAAAHGLTLTMLPLPPVGGYDVRALLASGRLHDAAAIVGHPPTWSRPPSGTLRLAWAPGDYQVVSWRPGGVAAAQNTQIVRLAAVRGGPARLEWPDAHIPFLPFVAGPADLAPVQTVAPLEQLPAGRYAH